MLNTFRQKRVAFLETDLGQSEFTSSCTVALHILDAPILGPPFTHQHLKPVRSHYIGSTVARDNPRYFLECVTELINIWRTEFAQVTTDTSTEDLIPLVINTCGWIKGMGLDLLISVIHEAKPTDICALYKENKDKNAVTDHLNELFGTAEHPPVMHNIPSVSTTGTFASNYTAIELRALATVSYFHQNLEHYGSLGKAWWDFQSRMTERVPWKVDWREGIDGIWVLYEDVPLSQLLYTLNGSIVALIGKVQDGKELDGPCHPIEQDIPSETASITWTHSSGFCLHGINR